MRDVLSWNLSLGRWAGVHVRLHVFFLLFIVLALHFCTQDPHGDDLWYGISALAILFLSVLAHELGHCVAARKTGGSAEQIVLWPLGGLAHVNVTHDPQSELVTAIAGPLVNFFICLVLFPLVVAGGSELPGLLNPLLPPPVVDGTLLEYLELVLWINWVLLLVNLLPTFPLDGGRVLRSMLYRRVGARSAMTLVSYAAKATALALVVAAWLIRGHELYSFATLPLALFGVFLFFAGKQEADRATEHDPDEAPFGYDFSQGYTSLERQFQPPAPPAPGLLRRWLRDYREMRRLRQQRLERDEEHRADDILARLHKYGRGALSEEDRALLARVSARLRNRLGG